MSGSVLAKTHLDFEKAEVELEEFGAWLAANAEFTESRVVDLMKRRKNLCQLIQLAAGKGRPDRLKHEFTLHGTFRADLVVGSTTARHFVLVEFEGGTKGSIFNQKRGTAQMKDWSQELHHAFGQVSDWTWAKNDNQHSATYRNAFGMDHFSETYLVVCGRTAFLNATDLSRLHWRSEKTTIASSAIRFWTYDELHTEASAALDVWRALKSHAL